KLGTNIVHSLFDAEAAQGDIYLIGEMLQETLPDAALVQIALSKDAEDLVLPWQILTVRDYSDDRKPADANDLWGCRFVIEVKRCGDGADARPRDQRSPVPVHVTYGRWNF